MKTSKTIADEFLKRKAQEKTEADETVEVEGYVKDIVEKKLAEIKAEKEAEKSKGLEVHTTKPMKEKDLEIHPVEPVIEKVEEPAIEKAEEPAIEKAEEPAIEKAEEPVIEKAEEPVIEKAGEPVKKVAREPVKRRKLNLMPPFSPFDRRRQK